MSMRTRRSFVALVGAAALLVVAAWYVNDVMPAVQPAYGAPPDVDRLAASLPVGLGYIAISAGVLVVALVARWADSRLVDIAYAIGGVCFAVLATVAWAGAVSVFGAPSVNALAILGIALLLIGLTDLGSARRRRPAPNGTAPDVGR